MKQKTISREELKDREFGKKAPQIFYSEQGAVFENTARSENEKFEEKPTLPKTDSSITSTIYPLRLLTF